MYNNSEARSRTIVEFIILTCTSVIIAFIANSFSPVGIPLFGQWNPELGTIHAGGKCAPHSQEVQTDELGNLLNDPSTIIIDARSHEDYLTSHIPEALSIPLGEFEDFMPNFIDTFPLTAPILIYCQGSDCHDSHDLAEILEDQGFTQIQVFGRGLEGWIADGGKVEHGESHE